MQDTGKDARASSRKLIVLSALLSALLMFTSLLYTANVTSWFTVRTTFDNPAKISNFVARVQYMSPTTNSWTTVPAGEPIKVTTDQAKNLQVRVQFRGFSAAYVRVSVFGGFYNKNTNTYLPQTADFWKMDSNSKWISNGGYLYYPEKLMKKDSYTTLTSFNIQADIDSLGTLSTHQEYEGEVYILVDAVQPDRISKHWGISALPTSS